MIRGSNGGTGHTRESQGREKGYSRDWEGCPVGEVHPRQREQRPEAEQDVSGLHTGVSLIRGGLSRMREAGASGGVGSVSGQGSRVLLGTVNLEGQAVPAHLCWPVESRHFHSGRKGTSLDNWKSSRGR